MTAKPTNLDLDRKRSLTIDWSDGRHDVLPLTRLRVGCPCAACKESRRKQQTAKRSLTILPGNFTGDPEVTSAELVGRYALRLHWADGHASGIYSFEYLRELGDAGTSS